MNYYLKQDFQKELQKMNKDKLISVIDDLITNYDDDFISNYILQVLKESE